AERDRQMAPTAYVLLPNLGGPFRAPPCPRRGAEIYAPPVGWEAEARNCTSCGLVRGEGGFAHVDHLCVTTDRYYWPAESHKRPQEQRGGQHNSLERCNAAFVEPAPSRSFLAGCYPHRRFASQAVTKPPASNTGARPGSGMLRPAQPLTVTAARSGRVLYAHAQ